MDNIYEEAYQCLLEEGYEDNDATEIVNYFYENNALDDTIYENKAALAKGVLNMLKMVGGVSGVWKPSAAAMRRASGVTGAVSRALQGKGAYTKGFEQAKNLSRMTGGGTIGTRSVPNIKQVSAKYGLDVPAPQPAWGGSPKNPWSTPDTRIVRTPRTLQPAKPETAAKVQAALPSAKELKALPAAGQSTASLRRSAAQTKLDTAALGTSGTGSMPGTTSAIVKRPPTLGSRVKDALKGKSSKAVAGVAALGAYGLTNAVLNGGKDRNDGGLKAPTVLADKQPPAPKVEPKAKVEPKTEPKAPVLKGKVEPAAPKSPTTPKAPEDKKVTSAKKKMTKIDKDVEELMGMRAASLDRQGKTKEASDLRAKIKAKYADYER